MAVSKQIEAPQPVIRPLILDGREADALRDLYAQSLKKNEKGFVQDLAFHGDIALRASLYRQNEGEMLGVFLGEILIGFGGIRKKDQDRVELCNLHLNTDYQGMGIGKKLSQILISEAKKRGFSIVELHVTITQQSAIGLYQRLGFIKTGQQVYNIGGIDYDTVFMELPL